MANVRDFAIGSVLTAPSPATSGTSLTLQSGEGALMPTTLPFYVVAAPQGVIPTKSNSEKLQVTARSTDTLTIVRAQGETTAKSIASGWMIVNAIFSDDLFNSTMVIDQSFTGSVNGSNTVFTTAAAFTSIAVYKNGARMKLGSDFTVTASNQITFSTAPASGAVLSYDAIAGGQIANSNADTVDNLHAVDLSPVGAVLPYAGINAPSGWLFCYGQAVSRSTYSNLFSALGTTYGSGDGSTTFNLPDMRGRVPAGQDDMGGTSANRLTNPGSTGGMDGDVLGNTGGQEAHTQTTAEMVSHNHSINWKNDGALMSNSLASWVSGNTWSIDSVTTQYGAGFGSGDGKTKSTGSGTAFNVVQPTIILNYIIRAV